MAESGASGARQTVANIVTTLRYEDAAAAIEWLCRAFGFEQRLVVPGENGEIVHAQLSFGNGMVMVSSCGAESHRVTSAWAAAGGNRCTPMSSRNFT